MPSIHADTQVVTQINVFTVPEGGQQALIELLTEAAKFASTTPGWISASVHRSRDDASRQLCTVREHGGGVARHRSAARRRLA